MELGYEWRDTVLSFPGCLADRIAQAVQYWPGEPPAALAVFRSRKLPERCFVVTAAVPDPADRGRRKGVELAVDPGQFASEIEAGVVMRGAVEQLAAMLEPRR